MPKQLNVKFPTTSPYVLQASAGRIWVASSINNTFTAPNNAGFTADPGYGFSSPSGPLIFDGVFNVTSPNLFGATGPTLLLFDDFRSGTAGVTLPNGTVPVAGSGTYSTAAFTFPPVYNRTNRSGTGVALSMLNNERAGGASGTGPFGRNADVAFGSHQQGYYIFYAETSRGTSDFRNNEGGGFGYYKHYWVQGDAQDAGLTTADMINTFTEQTSTNDPCTSVTWNSGVVTVTTASPIVFVAGYGPTWRVTMGSGHSSGGTNQVPAQYSGDFTATQTGTNTFTFPLAAFPGNCTTLGTWSPPGSLQGMNIPSPNCNSFFSGNSLDGGNGSGIPNSTTIYAGDANGIARYDKNGWNSIESAGVGDLNNPTTSPGILYTALYNSVNQQAINFINKQKIFFSPTKSAFAYWSHIHLMGLMQSMGTLICDRADLYIAIGPYSLRRFFVGDSSVPANCTTIMPCTVNSWSASVVNLTFRRGAFNTVAGNWLYWSDETGTINRVGQFT